MNLSVCLPAMRTSFWCQMYETLKEACKRYSFELVLVGPFDPPKELANVPNIVFHKTFMRPSSAAQLSVALCKGELWFNGADDAKFVPDSIDKALDMWHSLNDPKAIVNMRYTEGNHGTYNDAWWHAHWHVPLRRNGIPSHYKMVLNPLMRVDYFKELGGFDCSYEYQNFNIHDFIFRAQYDGASIHMSPNDVMICDHYPDGTPMGIADHWPIVSAYPMDESRFASKYNNSNALTKETIKINFDNWKDYQEPWKLRFGEKMYTSYEEMLGDRGIKRQIAFPMGDIWDG